MKKRIIDEIIRVEGGYVDNPNDSGGETNFGITLDVARENGYMGPMEQLPRELAFEIYVCKYWDTVKGDQLAALSESIAEEVVDTSVNMGPGRAGEFLQHALNVFNNRGRYYNDIAVDGSIGPATVKALKKYLSKRDEEVLVKALNCLQGSFYIALADEREKDETFIYGWFKNRVKI